MKYIIDIDALKHCLDLLDRPCNSIYHVNLNDVYAMIDRFPKDKLDNYPHVNTRSELEICSYCSRYGWDTLQCRDCKAENGYKCFKRKYNDNE